MTTLYIYTHLFYKLFCSHKYFDDYCDCKFFNKIWKFKIAMKICCVSYKNFIGSYCCEVCFNIIYWNKFHVGFYFHIVWNITSCFASEYGFASGFVPILHSISLRISHPALSRRIASRVTHSSAPVCRLARIRGTPSTVPLPVACASSYHMYVAHAAAPACVSVRAGHLLLPFP